MQNKKVDEVLSIKDLLDYVKIFTSTLYRYAKQGNVPGQKIGKHWKFKKRIIDQFVEENPKQTISCNC